MGNEESMSMQTKENGEWVYKDRNLADKEVPHWEFVDKEEMKKKKLDQILFGKREWEYDYMWEQNPGPEKAFYLYSQPEYLGDTYRDRKIDVEVKIDRYQIRNKDEF